MRSIRMTPRNRFAALSVATVVALLSSSSGPAWAGSDRKPIVLDTQTGIHDGQSGIVLQSAPLSREPMVAAQPAATLPELAPQAQPPILVSPYIDLGGGSQGAQPRPVYRRRSPGQ